MSADERQQYSLQPTGSIVLELEGGVLKVKLEDVGADAVGLFTVVSSELEQRHEGIQVELL